MRERAIRECGIAPQGRERASLGGWALTFDLPGIPLVEPAFASIAPQKGAEVHGVLWWMTPPEAKRLDQFESDRYDSIQVPVKGDASGVVHAKAYKNRIPKSGLLPSRRYLTLIAEGAREAGLPDAYLRTIEAQPFAYVPVLSEAATLAWRTFFGLQAWRANRRRPR